MQTEGNAASKPCQLVTALIDERAIAREMYVKLFTRFLTYCSNVAVSAAVEILHFGRFN